MTDTLTILRARGRRLAKAVAADGTITGYDNAYHYDGAEVAVSNLQHLGRLLTGLLPRSDCAIVRGALVGGQRVPGIRRLLHEQRKDGAAPTLYEVPHHWLAIDCDSVPCGDDVDRANIRTCAETAIDLLPEAFLDANCIAVASGSHGIKPGICIRLWFWLFRPMAALELKRWLGGTAIDRSLFSPAQLTYTAAPVFAPGRADHLPYRLIELAGEEFVHPPTAEELEPPAPDETSCRREVSDAPSRSRGGHRYVTAALDHAVANIISAGVGNRHVTLVREACCLARYIEAGHLTASEIESVLKAAAARAGKDDDDEVEKAIQYGIANPNTKPIPAELRRAP